MGWLVQLWPGLAAAVGTFAAVAAGWAAIGQVGRVQVLLAVVASLSAAALTVVQVRKAARSSSRAAGAVSPGAAHVAIPVDHFADDAAGPLAQLPLDLVDLVGRERELAEINRVLETAARSGRVGMIAICGQAGVGKTALAIHAAHLFSERYPDGQLYVDLRGIDPTPRDPAEVLAGFLRDLGMHAVGLPAHPDDRARAFRSRLAGRRVLVVLDNAADEAQLRPLLPGGGHCGVLITSRRRLATVEGLHRVDLRVLSAEHAMTVLRRTLGDARVTAEPQAAAELVRCCAGLPLALRITSARLTAKPHLQLTEVAARLEGSRKQLDELAVGDQAVRSSFTLSYAALKNQDRQTFRRLGLLAGADFAAWAAAALLKVPIDEAVTRIERLVDVHLVEVAGRDNNRQLRYRLHDLLRTFAAERLQADEDDASRAQLVPHLVLASVRVTDAADQILEPAGLLRGVTRRVPKWQHLVTPPAAEAIARDPRGWLESEHLLLVALVRLAHGHRLWEPTWQLAFNLASFLMLTARWQELEQIQQLALDASRQAGDRPSMARALHHLGDLQLGQQHYQQAVSNYEQSLTVFRELGDELSEAHTRSDVAAAYREIGRVDDAISSYQRALTIFDHRGERHYRCNVLEGLGHTYLASGHLDQAARWFGEAARDRRELGNQAGALRASAEQAACENRLDDAIDHLRQCVEALHSNGAVAYEAWTWQRLATFWLKAGNRHEADRALAKAHRLLNRTGLPSETSARA